MPLFFIGGTAGSGKSTVCTYFKSKGYEAYDVDSDGFAFWTNLETGYVHPKSSIKAEARTTEFIKQHGWHVPRDKVTELHDRAANKSIFLCGEIGNEAELQDLFAGIFVLHVDNEKLKKRLSSRTGNDWGWQPQELLHSLENRDEIYKKYHAMGATIVDSDQPVERVANEILATINHK